MPDSTVAPDGKLKGMFGVAILSFPLSYLQDGRDLPLLEHGQPARRLLLLPPLLAVPLVSHDRQRLVQVRLRLLRGGLLAQKLLLLELLLLLLLLLLLVVLLPRRSRQSRADCRRRRHEGHRVALAVRPHQPGVQRGRGPLKLSSLHLLLLLMARSASDTC